MTPVIHGLLWINRIEKAVAWVTALTAIGILDYAVTLKILKEGVSDLSSHRLVQLLRATKRKEQGTADSLVNWLQAVRDSVGHLDDFVESSSEED